MIDHRLLIQLIIAYTLTAAVVSTVIITLMAIIGRVKIANPKFLNTLFAVLIVELVTICVGFYRGFLEFSPKNVSQKIRSDTINDVNNLASIFDSNIERVRQLIPLRLALTWPMKHQYLFNTPEYRNEIATRLQNSIPNGNVDDAMVMSFSSQAQQIAETVRQVRPNDENALTSARDGVNRLLNAVTDAMDHAVEKAADARMQLMNISQGGGAETVSDTNGT